MRERIGFKLLPIFPAEWVMTYNRIPIKEYEELAKVFNPICFNAEEWVKLAKEIGKRINK